MSFDMCVAQMGSSPHAQVGAIAGYQCALLSADLELNAHFELFLNWVRRSYRNSASAMTVKLILKE